VPETVFVGEKGGEEANRPFGGVVNVKGVAIGRVDGGEAADWPFGGVVGTDDDIAERTGDEGAVAQWELGALSIGKEDWVEDGFEVVGFECEGERSGATIGISTIEGCRSPAIGVAGTESGWAT
jgi:hypothetical protein